MGSSLLGEHASGGGAVLLHGSANLVELGRAVVGHSLEATVVGSLVGVDQALQLSILLQVLPVTLVTDLDHAVHLGTHIGVDLGLSELVLVDDTGQLCDVSGGSLEREIGVLAVTGHASTDTTEAGSCLGDHNLEPVVGPLASGLSLAAQLSGKLGATLGGKSLGIVGLLVELGHSRLEGLLGSLGIGLNLSSVDGDRLVCPLDARVDGRCVRGLGALLGNDLVPEVPGSLSPVQGNLPADGCRFTNVRPVANVRKVRSLGKPPLSPTHRAVEIVPGFAGIVCHPAKESSLELLASSHVESEVAIHLGAHVGNVTLLGSSLSSNFALDRAKVIIQAHAALGGVCENLSSFLHIGGVHRAGSADAMHLGPGGTHHASGARKAKTGGKNGFVRNIRLRGDVHDRAAHGKPAKEPEGDSRAVHLFSHHSPVNDVARGPPC